MFSYRRIYFYIFVICVAALLSALYLQYVDHLEPCLLCMIQRLFFVGLAIVALLACWYYRHRHRFVRIIYHALSLVFCALGMLAASRQVWLQHLPPNQKAGSFCVPGTEHLLHDGTWSSLFQAIISGTPECSVVAWRLFGFSMAEWSLFIFVVLVFLLCCQWWRELR